jgi:hypothetical protein
MRTVKKIMHHIVTNREKRGGMTRQVGELETFLSPCANIIDNKGVEATVDVIAATDLINEEEVQTKKKKIKPRKKRKKRRGRRMKENASKATDKDGY